MFSRNFGLNGKGKCYILIKHFENWITYLKNSNDLFKMKKILLYFYTICRFYQEIYYKACSCN